MGGGGGHFGGRGATMAAAGTAAAAATMAAAPAARWVLRRRPLRRRATAVAAAGALGGGYGGGGAALWGGSLSVARTWTGRVWAPRLGPRLLGLAGSCVGLARRALVSVARYPGWVSIGPNGSGTARQWVWHDGYWTPSN